jgi:hypothetical protein
MKGQAWLQGQVIGFMPLFWQIHKAGFLGRKKKF